jgi:hypothetical protein
LLTQKGAKPTDNKLSKMSRVVFSAFGGSSNAEVNNSCMPGSTIS